jgi:hypothetical protein
MTLEALKSAVTGLPTARPSASALCFVTMAAIVPPPGRSTTTSLLTAPGSRRETIPSRRLRAESFVPVRSVASRTD